MRKRANSPSCNCSKNDFEARFKAAALSCRRSWSALVQPFMVSWYSWGALRMIDEEVDGIAVRNVSVRFELLAEAVSDVGWGEVECV